MKQVHVGFINHERRGGGAEVEGGGEGKMRRENRVIKYANPN